MHEVDDREAAAELARGQGLAPVGGEVHVVDALALGQVQGPVQAHAVGVAEVEAVVGLGHHDRVAAVDGEVEVVGVGDRDGLPRTARAGVDRRQAVALVVGHPQRLRSHDGVTCCGQGADGEVADDLPRALADDVDRVGLRVGHVDARGVAAHRRAEHPGAVGRVDVAAASLCGHGGACAHRQAVDLVAGAAVRVAAAEHERLVAIAGRAEVGQRHGQAAGAAHPAAGRIDRIDACGAGSWGRRRGRRPRRSAGPGSRRRRG